MNNTDDREASASLGDRPQAEASTALPRDVEEARRRPKLLAALVLGALSVGPIAPFTGPYVRRRDNLPAESSTRAVETDPVLLQEVQDLFEQGAMEVFYDGMESNFSRKLLILLGSRGLDALTAIADYLYLDQGNPEVVSEALRRVADFGGPETLSKRWSILRYGLKNRAPAVRDGAILGFASLDDPSAQAVLLNAGNSEQIRELKQLIEQVVARLGRPR